MFHRVDHVASRERAQNALVGVAAQLGELHLARTPDGMGAGPNFGYVRIKSRDSRAKGIRLLFHSINISEMLV